LAEVRVGTLPPGAALVAVLDADVRCPDALAADVRQTIEAHVRQAREAPGEYHCR
jgi:hypothetical protein